MEPVCLVIGAGAGIGGNVARRFAQEGYYAVLCRRSNEDGLKKMVKTIQDEGGKASGFILNAVEDSRIAPRGPTRSTCAPSLSHPGGTADAVADRR